MAPTSLHLFLQLPPEIRNRVYHFLLSMPNPSWDTSIYRQICPVFGLCKKIRAETRCNYLRRNVLCFHDVCSLACFLNTLQIDQYEHIINISVRRYAFSNDAQVVGLLSKCWNLRVLSLGLLHSELYRLNPRFEFGSHGLTHGDVYWRPQSTRLCRLRGLQQLKLTVFHPKSESDDSWYE